MLRRLLQRQSRQQLGPRVISFAGYEWIVKSSDEPVGPGACQFSGGEEKPGSLDANAVTRRSRPLTRASGSCNRGREVMTRRFGSNPSSWPTEWHSEIRRFVEATAQVDLEVARGLALESLAKLKLNPFLERLVQERLLSELSPENLRDTLLALGGFLASPSQRHSGGYLLRVAGKRVGKPSTRHEFLGVNEIAYIFVGSAANRGLILAPWVPSKSLEERSIYFQTTGGVLYEASFRSLTELADALDPRNFVRIHRSILINSLKIRDMDAPGQSHVRLAGMVVADRSESLHISRRYFAGLRARLGLPHRRGRKPQRSRGKASPGRVAEDSSSGKAGLTRRGWL